jgi:hypothetical protein
VVGKAARLLTGRKGLGDQGRARHGAHRRWPSRRARAKVRCTPLVADQAAPHRARHGGKEACLSALAQGAHINVRSCVHRGCMRGTGSVGRGAQGQ